MTLAATILTIVLGGVLTYLVHSTVLLCAACLATRRLGPGRDALAEWIWRTALVGGIVTAGAQTCWMQVAGAPLAPPLHVTAPTVHLSGGGSDVQRDAAGVASHEAVPSVLERAAVPQQTAMPTGTVPFSASASPAGSAPLTTGLLLALICAACLGGLAAFLALSLAPWRLARRLGHRTTVSTGPARDTLDDACATLGRPRHVRLTWSPVLVSPVAFGVLRPEICLPRRAVDGLDPSLLRGMLAHELGHLVRRDPLWLLVMRFVAIAGFLQPLNRLAIARLYTLAEYQCDAWAVAQTGARTSLARCLTEVASWMRHAGPAPMRYVDAAAMGRSASALEQRVVRLLEAPQSMHAWPARRALLATAVLLFGLGGTLPTVAPGAVAAASAGHTPSPAESVMHVPRGATDIERALAGELAALDTEIAALDEAFAELRGVIAPDQSAHATDLSVRLMNHMTSLLARRDRLRASLHAPSPRTNTPSDRLSDRSAP